MPKPVKVELPQSQVTPDPALEKRGRRDFSAQYKIRIVAEADACKHGELTQLLRREEKIWGSILDIVQMDLVARTKWSD